MISLAELLKNHKWEDLSEEYQKNLMILLGRVNKLRQMYNKPMYVTNCFRSMDQHIAIYAAKGIPADKVPMKSRHLYCQACDFADKDGSLKAFVKANDYQVLKDCELWMEDGSTTIDWLHVQIVPPKSNVREFLP
jgi:uncharacterized protein YcbK (DUF882 family)